MRCVGVGAVKNIRDNHAGVCEDDKDVEILIKPFVNGYMTIHNVPYVVIDNGHGVWLTPSTMMVLAQATRYMYEMSLSELDLHEYYLLSHP